MYRSPARPRRKDGAARRYPAQAAILFSSLPWRTPRPPACLLPWETQCAAAPTPRPATLKLLNGVSPGRDSGGRLVPTPPRFERAAPEPPDWLGAEALAQWQRIVPALDELGIVKPSDRALLVCFCECWSRFVHAVRMYKTEGIVVTTPDSGCLRRHPAVGIASEAAAQLRGIANEFGLSPAAERFLNIAPRDDDAPDPFTAGSPISAADSGAAAAIWRAEAGTVDGASGRHRMCADGDTPVVATAAVRKSGRRVLGDTRTTPGCATATSSGCGCSV